MASKKYFFGSLFGFPKPEEVIQELNDTASDPSSLPFITYGEDTKLFSWEQPKDEDTQLTTQIIEQASAYIEKSQVKDKNLVESPRLEPIDGTYIQDHKDRVSNRLSNHSPLLDNESSAEEDSNLDSSVGLITEYWQPQDSKIDILTKDVAAAVAKSTGCYLFPESRNQRIKLTSGDVKTAVQMLKNLEPLLVLMKGHNQTRPAFLNAHIKVSTAEDAALGISLVSLYEAHPGTDRIILPPNRRTLITKILLAEARYAKGDAARFQKPVNLDLVDVAEVDKFGRSLQFCEEEMPCIGNEANTTARGAEVVEEDQLKELTYAAAPSRFLAPTDANRMKEWTRAIDAEADPETSQPVPNPDEGHVETRRRVIEDSDSDSDSDSTAHRDRKVDYVVPATQFGQTQKIDSVATSTQQAVSEGKILNTPILSTIETSSALESSFAQQTPRSRPSIGISTKPSIGGKLETSRYSHCNKFDLLESPPDQADSTSSTGISDSSLNELVSAKPTEGILMGKQSIAHLPQHATHTTVSHVHQSPQSSQKEKISQRRIRTKPNRAEHSAAVAYGSVFAEKGDPPISTKADVYPFHEKDWNSTKFESTNLPSLGRAKQSFTHSHYSTPPTQVLVDISEDVSPERTMLPPPGLDYRSEQPQRISAVNYLDDDPIPGPQSVSPLKPSSEARIKELSDTASNMPNPPVTIPPVMQYVPRPQVRKRDINMLRRQTAAQLEATIAARSTVVGHNPVVNDRPLSPPRMRNETQSSTPKIHQTMNQKAPKGGKSTKSKFSAKQSNKQETKKEKDARIARAKAEAYGELPGSSSSFSASNPSNLQSATTSICESKKSKENAKVTALHAKYEQSPSIIKQTKKVVEELRPIFEASRAFVGNVEFEIQLGQAMIVNNETFNDQFLKPKDWEKIFADDRTPRTEGMFTNIVTNNGLEVDKLLEMHGFDDTTKLWSVRSKPATVVIDFVCQNRAGEEFSILVFNATDYKIVQPQRSIGMIAMHHLGQIWDACLVLQGRSGLKVVHRNISVGAQQLVDSLHVPAKTTAEVYYRQPQNGAFVVRSVSGRQTQHFGCLLPGYESVSLKVTECKRLIDVANTIDRNLHRSVEIDYERMSLAFRLYYEIAVVSDDINSALSMHNGKLEIGCLTPSLETGKNLVTFERMQKMVSIVSHVIEHVDWLGANNYGTRRQLLDAVLDYQELIQEKIAPHVTTQIDQGGLLPRANIPRSDTPRAAEQIPWSGSSITASMLAAQQGMRPIHGVRANTTASLHREGDKFFRFGIGGARIPVPDSEIVSAGLSTEDGIMPDDSASQVQERKSHNSPHKDDWRGAGYW